MMHRFKRFGGLLATACLVSAWGCGGSPPSVDTGKTEATVKGVVLVKGKPASGGEIAFDPSNYQRPDAPRKAPIGTDGSYTVKTLVGMNQITIVGPETRKNPELQFERPSFQVPSGESTHEVRFLDPK
jgi:hypothetical protein